MRSEKWEMKMEAPVLLSQRKFPSSALALLNVASYFEQPVKHFGALGAAGGKLGVRLLVKVFKAVKFIGDVQGGEDRNFQ